VPLKKSNRIIRALRSRSHPILFGMMFLVLVVGGTYYGTVFGYRKYDTFGGALGLGLGALAGLEAYFFLALGTAYFFKLPYNGPLFGELSYTYCWNRDQVGAVKRCLAALIADRDDPASELAKICAALPVEEHWTGYYLLRPDGTVINVDAESGLMQPEADEMLMAQIHVEATKRFPDLRQPFFPELPGRPSCPDCAGTGHLPAIGHFPPGITCARCFGLGWVPASFAYVKTQGEYVSE